MSWLQYQFSSKEQREKNNDEASKSLGQIDMIVETMEYCRKNLEKELEN